MGGGATSNNNPTTSSPPTTDDNTDPTSDLITPGQILSSLILDVDNDSDSDIVVAAYAGNGYASPLVLQNDGNANFSELTNAISYPDASDQEQTIYMAAIDANGDEFQDLVTVVVNQDYTESSFHLLIGSSSGEFTDASENIADSNINGWGEIVVADFDVDGHEDFILSYNPNGAQCEVTLNGKTGCLGGTIYLNDGEGNFAASQVDLNDQNFNEFYVSDSLNFHDITDGFDNGPYAAVWRVEVSDLNLDGVPDIVAPTYGEEQIPTFINRSTPGSLSFSIQYSDVPVRGGGGSALMDVNQDGVADLVMSEAIAGGAQVVDETGETTPVYIAISDGAGYFTLNNDFFFESQPGVQHARAWLVADFDQDGTQDLFVADHGNDFSPFAGYPNLLLLNL